MTELRGRRRRLLVLSLVVAGACSVPRAAQAQLHWDASAQVGAMKRSFLASRPDPGFGPSAQLAAHVALLPLVHVGGYLSFDRSPLPGDEPTRSVFAGGVRGKAMLPWIRGQARAWVFAGLGYAALYAPSYTRTFDVPDGSGAVTPRPGKVEGGGGTFFEAPIGVGVSYKLFPPWELSAELGARFGFGHGGSVYDPPGLGIAFEDDATERARPAGLDRLALGLTIGVLADL
jgi:hypothetical protein